MLGLARNRARMTPNTDVLINDEAVLQETLPTVAGISFLTDRRKSGESGLLEDEMELRVLFELLLQGVAHIVGPCGDVG
jgi:hypothetical protein